MGGRLRTTALALAVAVLLTGAALAAGCRDDGNPGYKHGGDELWHDVGYETTRTV